VDYPLLRMIMKNQREIYVELLAGETLFWGEDRVHLDENGFLVNKNGLLESWVFSEPEKWKIYKEPRWYENIPDGGVLCWVSDSDITLRKYIALIRNTISDGLYTTEYVSWKYATPLTKKEMQAVMNNAPEDKR